ncbi:uncharacterized protein LOC127286189 [Leptopilina boulardi]|uniref:uncharacterized protein LOC127286189 n=1 Tax=Leptopilina boulardi TaxID=63433 RepID=UPI0021F66327|nr:uncharacterized protein LOC127286189 [Leptopilina boulardi]
MCSVFTLSPPLPPFYSVFFSVFVSKCLLQKKIFFFFFGLRWIICLTCVSWISSRITTSYYEFPASGSSDLELVSLTRREDIVWPEVEIDSTCSAISDASTLPLLTSTPAQSEIPDTPASPDPVFEAYFDAHARPYSPAPLSTGVESVGSRLTRASSTQTNPYFPEGLPLEEPPAADEQVVLQLIARRRVLADGSIRTEYRWAGPNFY